MEEGREHRNEALAKSLTNMKDIRKTYMRTYVLPNQEKLHLEGLVQQKWQSTFLRSVKNAKFKRQFLMSVYCF